MLDFLFKHPKAADAYDLVANSPSVQYLADAAESAAKMAPVNVPLPPRETLIHRLVSPILTTLAIIIVGAVVWIFVRIVQCILLAADSVMTKTDIKVSSKGVSIPVKNIPHEEYVDITRRGVMSAYKRFVDTAAGSFTSSPSVKESKPKRSHRHTGKRMRKRIHGYYHDSSSESGSDTSENSYFESVYETYTIKKED
ncbi:hypothetical protein V1512DRAFT_252131 [Lipomyces arxii]|uniref:uncharacterized protein n=1 Tax=Lipomyces arxii TaxID=56418 RepID=UPI0034CEEBC0